jgi:DNA (cytosine-5)-methyltransferase 1
MTTIGSLCTGIGGLDLAVEAHYQANLIWHSDIDSHANEVMAVRRPDSISLGDLTAVDPSTLEVPDILTAGFPCTPVSHAGKQQGLSDDRWIFDDVVSFLMGLNSLPERLVFENVRNLLSHDKGRTALDVVRQVAGLGYDLRWGCVRASDAGLPHRRERWFAVATHPDFHRGLLGRTKHVGSAGRQYDGQAGPQEHQTERSGEVATHSDRPRLAGEESAQRYDLPSRCGLSRSETDAESWGPYAAAVRRWELISGVDAPEPIDENRWLRPHFVEWMMAFEKGWVTDVITTKTHSLRLLGNAVCPPQAALALDLLDGHA